MNFSLNTKTNQNWPQSKEFLTICSKYGVTKVVYGFYSKEIAYSYRENFLWFADRWIQVNKIGALKNILKDWGYHYGNSHFSNDGESEAFYADISINVKVGVYLFKDDTWIEPERKLLKELVCYDVANDFYDTEDNFYCKRCIHKYRREIIGECKNVKFRPIEIKREGK